MSISKTGQSIRVVIAASVVTFFGFAASVHADEVTFKYHPDELETSYGLKTLYNRIQNTAESYCTSSGRKALSTRIHEKKCTASLMHDFMVQIDDPRLYAYADRGEGWSRLSSNQ